MVNILDYNEFVDELKKTVYKNAKADLINKVVPSQTIAAAPAEQIVKKEVNPNVRKF